MSSLGNFVRWVDLTLDYIWNQWDKICGGLSPKTDTLDFKKYKLVKKK